KGGAKRRKGAGGGRPVFCGSHNMGAIRRLCQRCILLERGRVKTDASVQDAIDLYLTQAADGLGSGVFVREREQPADRPFYVTRVTTRRGLNGEPTHQFDCDQPFLICIEYWAKRYVP